MPVIWQNSLQHVEEHASDLVELTVCGGVCQWFGRIACASDLAELPVLVIWQNCLSVDSVPVIWQDCLHVDKHASDLAELPVPVIWQNCLSGGMCQ